MTYSIITSKHAQTDIDETVEYISVTLSNKKAARDFLDNLRKHYKTIASNPQLYPIARNPLLKAKGYHWFPLGNFMVFYTIDDQEKVIRIARVIYGKRNLEALL